MSEEPKTVCTLKADVFSAYHTLRRGTRVIVSRRRDEPRYSDFEGVHKDALQIVPVYDVTGHTKDGVEVTIRAVDGRKLEYGAPPELKAPKLDSYNSRWSKR